MNKIYATGALRISIPQYTSKDTRLWGLYDNFDAAEQTILANYGDFFEGYYNYALIEEICVNTHMSLYTPLPQQWWYKAEFDGDNVIVSKIEMPSEFQNISHWWVG
jgi:hypothetical protein